ncbi:MAG: glycosyltransferase [Candidatus Cloacimonetes bacterium]|nr:glycosyltransferase [Bacteroidota bacterium]MBL7086581.1 glycosyltransferase [Candidatus Cloacimonadota bacterium]
MKCAFFHDHKFLIKNNNVFSTGGLPNTVWDRYLRFFDEVVVFGRKTDNQKEGVLSERENVSFILFPEKDFFSSVLLRKKNLHNTIKNILSSVDCAIIRLPSLVGYIVAKKCRRFKIPYAVEVVGCQWDSYWHYGNLKGKLLAPILYLKMKKEVRRATHAIYVTQYFLQKRYPSQGYVANASNVMLRELSDATFKKRIKKINSTKQNLTIGLLANYNVKYKSFDVIIKALSILKNNGYLVYVKFAGSGTSHHIIKLAQDYAVEKQVECIGLLKGNEVINFLDEIDAYVHPSRLEGLPRAVIEALSRACPVLASSIGGIPELVNEKYLHSPGDYKMLAHQLKQIIDEKLNLASMARSNFERGKDYSREILDNKRNIFWKNFYEYTKKQKKIKRI